MYFEFLFFSSNTALKLIFWIKLDLQRMVPVFVINTSKIDVGRDEVFCVSSIYPDLCFIYEKLSLDVKPERR